MTDTLLDPRTAHPRAWLLPLARAVAAPTVALVLSLMVGAAVMLAVGIDGRVILKCYAALATGAFGSLNAISETFTIATPLVLAGLGVAIAFRAGLFNIGAEGQMLVGGMAALWVGFAIPGLAAPLHVAVALCAGAIVGMIWAAAAGWLKAATGTHEVITTIMMNLIALRIVDYLLHNQPFQKDGRADPVSETILASASLPRILGWIDPSLRLHLGFLLALVAVAAVAVLVYRSVLGFEFRATGENPDAASYAGMGYRRVLVTAMAFSGALAGLGGGMQILGVLERATPNFTAGLGFDAIAVALLGRVHPLGVLLAAVLFGALDAGGRQMQAVAGISIDLIAIMQASILVFVAAPLAVRGLLPVALRHPAPAQ